MEENMKKEGEKECGYGCGGKCGVMCDGSGKCGGMHGMCCGCCGGRRRILRVIIKILILVAVFCGGVNLGELKSYLGGGFYGGWHMNPGRFMMLWNGARGNYFQGQQAPYGMMGGSANNGNGATSTSR